MVEKAAGLDVDAVVFDLEDSVPAAEKDAAREGVRAALANWPEAGAPRAYVRVNPPRNRQIEADAGALADAPDIGIVVPKVDRSLEVEMLAEPLGLAHRDVIVTIETPRGLLHLEELADFPLVDGLCLGGEDLAFNLGMRRTPGGEEFDIPRFLLLAAARAAEIAAYDVICPEFRDLDVLERDARRAAALGMDGKFAIHPAQPPVIRAAFRPDDAELARARAAVDAYDAAVTRGEGAVAVDGQMIDPPVAERYRMLLQRWS
jgi:citrate lyase subunit beta/citryl-CoA lyase